MDKKLIKKAELSDKNVIKKIETNITRKELMSKLSNYFIENDIQLEYAKEFEDFKLLKLNNNSDKYVNSFKKIYVVKANILLPEYYDYLINNISDNKNSSNTDMPNLIMVIVKEYNDIFHQCLNEFFSKSENKKRKCIFPIGLCNNCIYIGSAKSDKDYELGKIAQRVIINIINKELN